MKIIEVNELIGSEQVIVDDGNESYLVSERYFSNNEGYERCGIYFTMDTRLYCIYSFKHDGKIYSTGLNFDMIEQVNFENELVKLYKAYGNWYDAFEAMML